MSGTEKALIITAITALAVVLALARREPPRLVGVRGTENQADQAEPENVTRVDDWLALVKNEEREEAIA